MEEAEDKKNNVEGEKKEKVGEEEEEKEEKKQKKKRGGGRGEIIIGPVEKSPTSGRPWKVEDEGRDRRGRQHPVV